MQKYTILLVALLLPACGKPPQERCSQLERELWSNGWIEVKSVFESDRYDIRANKRFYQFRIFSSPKEIVEDSSLSISVRYTARYGEVGKMYIRNNGSIGFAAPGADEKEILQSLAVEALEFASLARKHLR